MGGRLLAYPVSGRDGVQLTLARANGVARAGVRPGGRVSVQQKVIPPATPGRYVLELDPVFETVAWFSEKNGGKTFRVPVEVLPPAAPAPQPPEAGGAR